MCSWCTPSRDAYVPARVYTGGHTHAWGTERAFWWNLFWSFLRFGFLSKIAFLEDYKKCSQQYSSQPWAGKLSAAFRVMGVSHWGVLHRAGLWANPRDWRLLKGARHILCDSRQAELAFPEGGAALGQWGWRDFWAPSGYLVSFCPLQEPRAVAHSHAHFIFLFFAAKGNIYRLYLNFFSE